MPDIEEVIQAQRIRLLKSDAEMLGRIQATFNTTIAEVERQVAQRSAVLAQQLRSMLEQTMRDVLPIIDVQRRYAILIATTDFQKLLELQGYRIAFGIDPQAIDRISAAIRTPTPLTRLLEKVSMAGAQQAQQDLFTSVALGENPKQTGARIRKTLNISKYRAERIGRTEVLRSYRGAMRERMSESHVVSGWEWVSAKSTRTCAMCWAMHGSWHRLDETFGTHPNCRCSQAPVAQTRLIVAENGADEFAKLSAANQRSILGPAKYEAYRDGRLQLSSLIGTAQSADWGLVRYERSLQSVLG